MQHKSSAGYRILSTLYLINIFHHKTLKPGADEIYYVVSSRFSGSRS